VSTRFCGPPSFRFRVRSPRTRRARMVLRSLPPSASAWCAATAAALLWRRRLGVADPYFSVSERGHVMVQARGGTRRRPRSVGTGGAAGPRSSLRLLIAFETSSRTAGAAPRALRSDGQSATPAASRPFSGEMQQAAPRGGAADGRAAAHFGRGGSRPNCCRLCAARTTRGP